MKPNNFDEYMADESRVSPVERESIKREVAAIADSIKMDHIREQGGVLETIYLIRYLGMNGTSGQVGPMYCNLLFLTDHFLYNPGYVRQGSSIQLF